MGALQRAKGARLEREAAAALTGAFGCLFERSARNGVDGAIDLETHPPLDGYGVEVKGRRAIAIIRWLEKLEGDTGKPGLVIMREDRGGWCVLLRLPTLERLYHRRHPHGTDQPEFD